MQNSNHSTAQHASLLFITQSAAIAAIYTILTLIANAMGLAKYAVQIRFSEALTILPFFTPAAIPGLFIRSTLRSSALESTQISSQSTKA
nr:QueT transporter family protein [Butyrivibrio proteoclasticus]